MPKRNIELLTKIRNLIATQPDKLNMNSWSMIDRNLLGEMEYEDTAKIDCGTTQCIAGWAVQLSGWKFLVRGFEVLVADEAEEPVVHVSYCVARNGRTAMVDQKARQLLGITPEESFFLFLDVENDRAIEALDMFIAGESLDLMQERFGIVDPE